METKTLLLFAVAAFSLLSSIFLLLKTPISKDSNDKHLIWHGDKGSFGTSQATNFVALRITPNNDPLTKLQQFVDENAISAATIVSCVGSFSKANVRYANQPSGTLNVGHFEIVSMVGTLSKYGSHVHVSLSNTKGDTFGGHLLAGNAVYTTAEIVIANHSDLEFKREPCKESGYNELYIINK